MLPRLCMHQVFVIKTTLPGDWVEAFVGEFEHRTLLAGAACAEHQRIQSMYRWKGEVESSQEWSVQFTVSAPSLEPVLDHLRTSHPYETPQILHWAANSEPPYYQWIGTFMPSHEGRSEN